MDPNACLAAMREAYGAGDLRAATERMIDLKDWLTRGGFPPEWDKYTSALYAHLVERHDLFNQQITDERSPQDIREGTE